MVRIPEKENMKFLDIEINIDTKYTMLYSGLITFA
jgi:hypothetical protein